MRKLLITIGLLVLQTWIYAQTIKLDVIFRGDKIGTTTVSRTKMADGIYYYELKSNSVAEFMLMKRATVTKYTSTYEHGKMTKSSCRYEVNGDVDSFGAATWDGSKYVIETEKGKSSYDKQVVNSVLTLFFEEPVNKSTLWSERASAMLPITKTNTHEYTFKNAVKGGSNNIYRYKDGKMYEVEMPTPAGPSYMRVVK